MTNENQLQEHLAEIETTKKVVKNKISIAELVGNSRNLTEIVKAHREAFSMRIQEVMPPAMGDSEKKRFVNSLLANLLSANFAKETGESYLQVVKSSVSLASLGLLPDGNHAAIFKQDGKTYSPNIMVRGYEHILQRYANLKITANVIYANDTYDIDLAENYIKHSPALTESGAMVAAYCKIHGGEFQDLQLKVASEIEPALQKAIEKNGGKHYGKTYKAEFYKNHIVKYAANRAMGHIEKEMTLAEHGVSAIKEIVENDDAILIADQNDGNANNF